MKHHLHTSCAITEKRTHTQTHTETRTQTYTMEREKSTRGTLNKVFSFKFLEDSLDI